MKTEAVIKNRVNPDARHKSHPTQGRGKCAPRETGKA
jgi:hypothetical protein